MPESASGGSGVELGLKGRRVLLLVHVLLATLLTGGLAALLVLLAVSRPPMRAGADQAAFVLLAYLITPAGLAFAFTGLAFGLLTRWGFARFNWVMAKWAGTVLLGVALVAALGPSVATLAALADTGIRPADVPAYRTARFAAVAWTTGLLALAVGLLALSVFKPGRARRPVSGTFPWRRQLAGALLAAMLGVLLAAQWLMLGHFRRVPIAVPPVAAIRSGLYEGHAAIGGFDYSVALQASDGRIESLRVGRNRNTRYAELGARITLKILSSQSGCVDWVSGASTTSRAIQAAAADALRQAAADSAAVSSCDR